MVTLDNDWIVGRLKDLSDEDYRQYTKKLVSTVPPEKIIGVRAPKLQALAAEFATRAEDCAAFLKELPHHWYEENVLHAYLLSTAEDESDYAECMARIEKFLPFVDNWAVCDAINPKVFARHPKGLEEKISEWLRAEHAYTIRFGLLTLMRHYLDEFFDEEHFQQVIDVSSSEYYVQMAEAWYFATALVKRYDQTVALLENEMLEPTVHGMTIQKAVASQRIPYERKKYLRTLKLSQ